MLYGNIYSGYKSVKPRYVNYKIVHGTNLFAKVFNLEVLCRFLSDTSAKIELIHLEKIFEMLRRFIKAVTTFLFFSMFSDLCLCLQYSEIGTETLRA